MCDYSITAAFTRDAKAGDELVTKQFGQSTGFADIGDTVCAVCLKEGTEMAFARGYALVRGYWFRARRIGSATATFRKLDVRHQHMHHDALEFSNGHVVRVHDLVVNQHATVLTLPVSEQEKRERHCEPKPQFDLLRHGT